jgi:hypothetical protein
VAVDVYKDHVPVAILHLGRLAFRHSNDIEIVMRSVGRAVAGNSIFTFGKNLSQAKHQQNDCHCYRYCYRNAFHVSYSPKNSVLD